MKPRHSPSRLQVFLSWPFFVSLAILLLNDSYLKATYSNWVTGKLSDFAGIFLVSLVLFALMPGRIRVCGCVVVGLFVLWKSPVADPFVDLVRSSGVTNFGRVVDYSDLIALAVIPLAASAANCRRPVTPVRPWLRTALAVPAIAVFVFAVTGTTFATFSQRYTIQKSDPNAAIDPQEVLKIVNAVAEEHRLQRTEGDNTSLSGEFANKHFAVTYSIDPHGRSTFEVLESQGALFRGSSDKKMERFKDSLRYEMGSKFSDLDIILPIHDG